MKQLPPLVIVQESPVLLDELRKIAVFERYVPPGRLAGKAELSGVSGCYVIEHVRTGMVYVGSTISLAERVRHNLVDARKGEHSNRNMNELYQDGDVLNAYISRTPTRGDAYTLEQVVVNHFNNNNRVLNIGITDVKRPTYGVTPLDSSRIKMQLSQVGRTHSEATKQKMREWNIGRKHTPETCAKISKLQKERCSSGAGHIHLTSIKQSIGVSVNDTVFPSIKAAARALGIHDSVVGRRCKSPNFKNFTFIPTE